MFSTILCVLILKNLFKVRASQDSVHLKEET